MEELRPRIKPKAPKALKQNVLKEAVKLTPIPNARNRGRMWFSLSAAAILFIGIMTFALWKGNPEPLPKQGGKGSTELHAEVKDNASRQRPRLKASPTSSLHTYNNKKVVAPASHASVPDEPLSQQSLELCEEKNEGSPTPDIVTNEIPVPMEELGETERQLLANFEAHRDIVNACLAEELAQVRFTQQRLGQSAQQYLQQYRELQQRLTEQLRKDIESIGNTEKPIEEV